MALAFFNANALTLLFDLYIHLERKSRTGHFKFV